MWLPDEFVVYRSGLPVWKLDNDALERSVRSVVERDLSMAQKHFENGKPANSKKVLTHTLRLILMATQILDQGKITDFECANSIFEMLRSSYHLTSWELLLDEITPIKDDSFAKFEQALRGAR